MEFFGRSRILSAGSFNGKVVAYWMVRDKRVQDNWALLKAQEIALKNRVPLLICFQYNGEYEIVNIRNYRFLFKGLIEMEKQLQKWDNEEASEGELKIAKEMKKLGYDPKVVKEHLPDFWLKWEEIRKEKWAKIWIMNHSQNEAS